MSQDHSPKGRHEEEVMNSQKGVTGAEVKKAVQKVLKQVLERIENEPTLVIDPDDDDESLSDDAVTDIRKWLFERR